MSEPSITTPISIDSLFADFNRLKPEDLTAAIEVLAYENQFLLGKEDGSKSLSLAIELIGVSGPMTGYQSALFGLLSGIKSYHLELKKKKEEQDYSKVITGPGSVEKTLDRYTATYKKIFLAMACDYLGLAMRNAGDNDAAVEYFQKARSNADEKWRGLYIDFNLGRLTGDIEMLKNAARARETIMNDQKARYEESDNHLFLEYKWAVKNVLGVLDEKDKDRQEFEGRWSALESDYRNGHFLSGHTN